jgi:hypothetical protein
MTLVDPMALHRLGELTDELTVLNDAGEVAPPALVEEMHELLELIEEGE